MDYNTFIDRVQQEANLDSRDRAVEITRAVLETLGERLDRSVKDDVAAQLPSKLKDFLLARGENTDGYNVPEFYNRVGARSDLKYYDAAERTWQVMVVLQEAISAGQREKILSILPGAYGELFGEQVPNRQRPKP